MSRAVWALADEDVTEHLLCSGEEKARDWLSVLMATLPHTDQTTVFVTLWSIWHARRKAIHEQEFRSPMSVHMFVERYVADLGKAYAHQPRRASPGDGGRAPRWIPPPAGVMKINVDAAVSKNTGLGTVAAVARDAEGVFCGASAVVLPGKTDAETLEALACREALSLAQDINTRRIRVASDCLNVVRSMDQGTMGVYAHVVREFKETARELDEVVVVHERRVSNKEAHNLARSSVLFEHGRHVWMLAPLVGVCIPSVIR
jgi:ribonuclease HI